MLKGLLVVDDEADARELLTTLEEYVSVTKASVGEALEALERLSLDVVSDIGMPGKTA